ncbi:MAG: LacI family DNA-binding transcriptional regulator, partial [Ruminococcus sp.]|nr:LacI family DNA-binding transcriptional regulator [Ruminococcus sp.]
MFDGIIVDTVSLTQDRVTWPMTQIESILKKHNYKNVVAIDIPLADYHLIETDDVISFKKITDHILDVHKCENVWVLDGPENMTVTQKRLEGIKKSFEE